MSIDVEILLDLDQAEKAANEFERDVATTMARAANKSAAEFEGFAKRAAASLERVRQNQVAKFNDIVGVAGNVTQAVATAADTMGLFSKSTTQALGDTAGLVGQLSSAGSAFGLYGAAAGAAAGLLIGLIKAMGAAGREAEELKAKLKADEDKKQQILDDDRVKSWEQLNEAIDSSKEHIDDFQKPLDKLKEKLDALPEEAGKRAKALVGSALDFDATNAKASLDALTTKLYQVELKTTDLKERERERKAILKELRDIEKSYGETVADATESANDALSTHTKGLGAATTAAKDLNTQILENIRTIQAAQKEREENGLLDRDGMREDRDIVAELKDGLELLKDEMEPQETILDVDGMRDAVDVVGEMTEATAKLNDEFGLLGADMRETIVGFGQDMANTFAGAAVNSVDAFFESIATGQARTLKDRQAARAAFLRDLGTQLIADGTKNELIGVGRGLFGDPSGWALAAWGLGEQATGFGFGGVGARAQRRTGYGDEQGTSAATGSRGPSSGVGGLGSGNQSQAAPGTVIYQIYAGGAPGSTTVNAGDGPASLAKANREITKIQSQGSRIGGGGFSRRAP